MEQKHFMDIQHIREEDTELRERNTKAFYPGCVISITEKYDGSNFSVAWDEETQELKCFSRKKELNFQNTLNGFWNFVQAFPENVVNEFRKHPNWRVFGEANCLSGDTLIRKTSVGKHSQYMTIREMYNFLNTPTPDMYHHNINKGYTKIVQLVTDGYNKYDDIINEYIKTNEDVTQFAAKVWITKTTNKGYIEVRDDQYEVTDLGKDFLYNKLHGSDSWWNRYGMPRIFSLYQNEWRIKPNRMTNIIYSGEKEVYRVTTKNGFNIKTTIDHRFLTPYGFKPLKDIKCNECVAITRFFSEAKKGRSYGKGTQKILSEQKEYKKEIGHCEICGRKSYLQLHHKDCNYLNNDKSNWQVVCKYCHRDIHKDRDEVEYNYYVDFDYIVSIEKVGIEDCYDISMEGTENEANFIANGFVVHNCKNKIIYNDTGKVKHWYVYDIYDMNSQRYLMQGVVKQFCIDAGLEYIHELYYGPFISWKHCRSFMNTPAYGDRQEGIVIKQQGEWDENDRNPHVLKIVNEDFRESMKTKEKIVNPEVEAAKEEARNIMESIVTPRRVEKMLFKLRDEGILPEKIQPTDFKIVAQNLPKAVWDDIMKEEKELVVQCGEYGGKMCQGIAMSIARDILLGT